MALRKQLVPKSYNITVSETRTLITLTALVFLSSVQVVIDVPFYRSQTVETNSIHGILSSVAQVVLVLGVFAIFLAKDPGLGFRPDYVSNLVVVFSIYLLLVTVINGSSIASYLPITLLCILVSRKPASVALLSKALGLGSTLVLLLSAAMLIIAPSAALMKVNTDRFTIFPSQVAGATPHPNTLGLFAGIGLGVALLSQFQMKKNRIFLATLSSIMVVASGSRLSYALAVLALVIFFFRKDVKRLSKRIRTLIIVTGAATVFWFLSSGLGSALSVLNGRDQIWSDYLSFWQKHPFLGGGLDVGRSILQNAANSVTTYNGGQSHNEYIGDLVKGGIVGLILLLCVIVSVSARLIKSGAMREPVVLFICLSLLVASLVEQVLVFTMGSRSLVTVSVFLLAALSVDSRYQGPLSRNQQNCEQ